ncbi:hypothetical protein JKF63_01351 [Porcisia hertigi]|uniref:FYVE-type domain-containing protein n=1 Tax=Porcisia hertigi TaxID=2761500 RepID=A0A836KZC6_9TRYP|nr:hypothetical protein JKF63_01351 [Porcisia hertigi]
MGEKQSKGYWQDDEDAPVCNGCGCPFSTTLRRHHCRNCGYVLCGDCSRHRAAIPMRGMTGPERVCDACYLALRNNNIAVSSLKRGGPGFIVNRSETPGRTAVLATCSTFGGPSIDFIALDPAATQPSSIAPEMTEEERKAEEYYSDLYRGDTGDQSDDAAENVGTRQAAIGPEAMEKERLIQRWNMVRQATVYIDILLQQSERVEPDTAVEYSRETEALTLEPELPISKLGTQMLPLPKPTSDSARYLVEPVTTIGIPATTMLEKVAAGLTQRLATRLPTHAPAHKSDDYVGY